MIPAPRPPVGPLPGDLYLDSAVPACERVTLTRNGWSAQVTHVWTGTGWTRLVPGVVKEVPTNAPLPAPGTSLVEEPALAAWRRRKQRRPAGADRAAEVARLVESDLNPDDDWERAGVG